MAKPTRTFTGEEGQPSTGSAGPEAIKTDIDSALKMFDPDALLPNGDPGGIDEENLRDGAVSDRVIGTRTIDQSVVPNGHTGTLTALLSGIANRIKAITGRPNWYDDPDFDLTGTASAVPNTLIRRNADARAAVADPQTPNQIATKRYVDGISQQAQDGYIIFPNGLIMQWMVITESTGTIRKNWPIPFPNNVFNVQATVFGASVAGRGVQIQQNPTLQDVQIRRFNTVDGGDSGLPVYVLGIGN